MNRLIGWTTIFIFGVSAQAAPSAHNDSKAHEHEEKEHKPAKAEPKAEAKAAHKSEHGSDHKLEPVKAEFAKEKTSSHKTKNKESQPAAHASSSGHSVGKSVEPEVALRWLTNGNTRFNKSNLRNDGQSKKDVARLSKGQAPHSIILSCSDSRVPPEVVFDQKLGEIFTVRTAGEALDDNVVGSIEYAVEHLGSRLIVVLGHTSCGAVTAAYNTLDGSSVGTSALDGLVHDIHPRISHFKGMAASPRVVKESWANAQGVAADLTSRSSLIRNKMESGSLRIVPAMYDLDTGKVTFRGHLQPALERGPASK